MTTPETLEGEIAGAKPSVRLHGIQDVVYLTQERRYVRPTKPYHNQDQADFSDYNMSLCSSSAGVDTHKCVVLSRMNAFGLVKLHVDWQ